MPTENIAVVPFHHLEAGDPVACREFRQSSEEFGLAFIEGTDLTEGFMQQGVKPFYEVINRPAEEIQALVDESRPIYFQRGPTPPRTEVALASGEPDYKFCWFVGDDAMHRHNERWPGLYPKNIWPKDADFFHAWCVEKHRRNRRIAVVAQRALEKSYDLPEGTFVDRTNEGPHVDRLLWYLPLTEEQIKAGAVWSGKHRDFQVGGTNLAPSFFVDEQGRIVPRPDERAGLWLIPRKGGRLQGRAPKGCITRQVSQGEEILTGGALVATTHGVDAPSTPGIGRFASAYFDHGHPDGLIYPLPMFQTPETIKKYGPPRLGGTYAYKLLIDIHLAPPELAGKVFGYPNQAEVDAQSSM